MSQNAVDDRNSTQLEFEKTAKKVKFILPFYILVPVLFAVAFQLSGTSMEWKAFGLGELSAGQSLYS